MSIWNELLKKLEETIPKSSFDTWLKNTILLSCDERSNTLIVRAENEFARDWLESQYTEHILAVLFEITKQSYKVNFVSTDEKSPTSATTKTQMTEREILERLLEKVTNIEKEQIAIKSLLEKYLND